MSLQKPYDINIRGQTIDKNEEYRLRWRITGDISVGYQIIIKENDSGDKVFDTGKITSYATSYLINFLEQGNVKNGKEYGLTVTLYSNDDSTITSDRVVFKTSSRPFISIDEIGTVRNQSFKFNANYSQDEDIEMQSFTAYLYNSNRNLLSQSDIKTSPPLEHIFYNLQSENSYFVEFRATGRNGLVGSTGLISFDVLYSRPEINVAISAENTDDAGVYLNWNVIQIIGRAKNPNEDISLLYIDDPKETGNKLIDLRNSEGVIFEEGFNVTQDFSIGLWVRNYNHRETILEISGQNGRYVLTYDQVDSRFYLQKILGDSMSEFRSDIISSDDVFVNIRQIHKDIDIMVESI